MISLFKKFKLKNDVKKVRGMLGAFYNSEQSDDHIPLKSINEEIRSKVLLFTYGAFEAYCQANKIPEDQAAQISSKLDEFVYGALGMDLSEFSKTDTYLSAGDVPQNSAIVETGRQTFIEYSSKEEMRWMKSVFQLRHSVDEWTQEELYKEAYIEAGKDLPSGDPGKLELINRLHKLSAKWRSGEDLPSPKVSTKEPSKGLFDKLKRPKEYGHILGLLSEIEHKYDSTAFKLVQGEVKKNIRSMAKDISKAVKDPIASSRGDPCVHILYVEIANVSGDFVASGEYHLYRGWLKPGGIGGELLKIFDDAIDELTKSGYMDENEASEQKDGIREQIKQVG